ncbi:MAG: glycosyltransferase family 39 protein [Candidatus Diapherotrites archaeon]|nr:glycosyltransferase family 39 protein [Candidatus Diapherotrites archaeon]
MDKIFGFGKKTCAILALISLAGLAMRFLLINSTDITHDEAFYVILAYKLFAVLWSNAVVLIASAALLAIFLYLFFVRKSWKLLAAVFAVVLFVKYFFKVPYITHAPSEFFSVAVSVVIFLSRLPPNVAGELLSSLASIAIAFSAFLFARRWWGEQTGIFAFALLSLSPYAVFFSTASFLDVLGMAFLYSSVFLFFKSFGDARFFPVSGLLFSLAIATRFTAVLALPLFALFFLAKKNSLQKTFLNGGRKEAALFAIIVVFTVLFYAGLMKEQWEISAGKTTIERNPRVDITEAHYSPFVAGAFPEKRDALDPGFMLKLMALFYSPIILFFGALACPRFLAVSLSRRDFEKLFLLALLFGFFAYFSFLLHDQRINYLTEIEMPLLLFVAGTVFWLGKRFLRADFAFKALALAAIAFFLVQSFAIISAPRFSGLSQFMQSVPDDAVVFASGPQNLVLHYYAKAYVYDTQITKPFLAKILGLDLEQLEEFRKKADRISGNAGDLSGKKAEFAVINNFLAMPEIDLSAYRECNGIWFEGKKMFRVFALNECPA